MPEAAGAEAVDHCKGDVSDKRKDEQLHTADVIERFPHQEDVIFACGGNECHTLASKAQHCMREHHAFRVARGPGGVADRKTIRRTGNDLVETRIAFKKSLKLIASSVAMRNDRDILERRAAIADGAKKIDI